MKENKVDTTNEPEEYRVINVIQQQEGTPSSDDSSRVRCLYDNLGESASEPNPAAEPDQAAEYAFRRTQRTDESPISSADSAGCGNGGRTSIASGEHDDIVRRSIASDVLSSGGSSEHSDILPYEPVAPRRRSKWRELIAAWYEAMGHHGKKMLIMVCFVCCLCWGVLGLLEGRCLCGDMLLPSANLTSVKYVTLVNLLNATVYCLCVCGLVCLTGETVIHELVDAQLQEL